MITSTPAGAEVVLDGNVLGKTPFRRPMPRTGRDVKLAIKLKGYRPEAITVHTDAPTSKQNVKLAPVAHDKGVNPFD